MASPTRYIIESPTGKSVRFAGVAIDIKQMAEDTGCNYTYLSHIFSRNSAKLPSTAYGMLLADTLGMTYLEFLEQLLEQKEAKTA